MREPIAICMMLQMIDVNLKAEIKTISYEKRDAFRYSHENAASYKTNGTTTNKGSLYNFEQRLKRIKVLVVQHVHDCLGAVNATYRSAAGFRHRLPRYQLAHRSAPSCASSASISR